MILAVPFLVVYKDYYLHQQRDLMASVYKGMNFEVSTIDELINQCFLYETRDNVNYIIFEDDLNTIIYTSSNLVNKDDYSYESLYSFPQGINMNNIKYNSVEKPYFVSNVVNNISNTESMHLISRKNINDKIYNVVIEKSIANIDDSVKGIILFLMICIIPVSTISCFVISRVSEYFIYPIVEISERSKELANLNFEQKIEVKTNDEIGLLAQNINKLSEELEHKIYELENINDSLKTNLVEKERNSKIQEEFISNVSHELKTPITLILGYAEALKMDIDKESEKEYLNIIVNESHKMNSLITDLLDMARLKSGDTELILKEFDISSVLKNIKTKYKLLFLEKGIEFNSNITDEEIPVLGDKFKLELVITNYIVNAIRYVDENKKINLNIYDKGEFVRVEVFNTSPQIKQEDIDRIWGSFYKVDKAHSREKGGTGIGLYIVKTIMELHGYEYGVQNMEDGVVFYLNIKKAG
jgi:signal transduction histidine kinase